MAKETVRPVTLTFTGDLSRLTPTRRNLFRPQYRPTSGGHLLSAEILDVEPTGETEALLIVNPGAPELFDVGDAFEVEAGGHRIGSARVSAVTEAIQRPFSDVVGRFGISKAAVILAVAAASREVALIVAAVGLLAVMLLLHLVGRRREWWR